MEVLCLGTSSKGMRSNRGFEKGCAPFLRLCGAGYMGGIDGGRSFPVLYGDGPASSADHRSFIDC